MWTGKMKNKVLDVSNHVFQADEKVLFDTNIWLKLFSPPGNPTDKRAAVYSRAYQNLVKSGAKSVIDLMVLSEYLNRYCRIVWTGGYSKKYLKYKEFRNSVDFRKVAAKAAQEASNICSRCVWNELPVGQMNIVGAIQDFELGTIDFNDAVLVEICRKQGIKIMTDDGDFQRGGITVLTANHRLMQACK